MIETASYKAAHHQQITIQHLKYENELLTKRNKALALENEKLLEELDEHMKKMQGRESKRVDRILKEHQELQARAKEESKKLFFGLDRKTERSIGGLVASYKECLSNGKGSISEVYNHLIEIIQTLLNVRSQQKQLQLREKLNINQQRLIQRKTARDRTSQVVHLIKQPPKELQLQYRQLREQINQQREIYQKIIRKTKRDNVNIHTLEVIYEQIEEMTGMRWKLKQQEAKLLIMERQFQLGNLQPLNQHTTSSFITELGHSIKTLKASIQAKINAFS